VRLEREAEAVDAGLAPADDAQTVAVDLRTAVNGTLAQSINEPDLAWPRTEAQIDRYLAKIVGLRFPDAGSEANQ
jgi:hypothetical protein